VQTSPVEVGVKNFSAPRERERVRPEQGSRTGGVAGLITPVDSALRRWGLGESRASAGRQANGVVATHNAHTTQHTTLG
jgi:hypothetical protein